MAKFHFRHQVTQLDVDHAIKLMDYSFETLEKIHRDDNRLRGRRDQQDDRFGGQDMRDKLTTIINDVRNVMQQENLKTMNQNEITKQLMKSLPQRYGKQFTKDNILDTLSHYKKLQVLYVDNDENVVFL